MKSSNSNYLKIILSFILLISLTSLISCQWDYQDYGIIMTNQHRQAYFWGTYKPNLYFAMRNRLNTTINFGMMWYGADESHYEQSGNITQRMRHECTMKDNLKYRWEIHNSKDYGRQVLEDKINDLELQTEFVKTRYSDWKDQAWDVNIKGSLSSGNQKPISLILYVNLEDFLIKERAYLRFDEESNTIIGFEQDKEEYRFKINIDDDSGVIDHSYQKYRKAYEHTWRVKQYVTEDLQKREVELNELNKKKNKRDWKISSFGQTNKINAANIIAIQLIVKGPFKININYDSKQLNLGKTKDLDKIITTKVEEFNAKFDKQYPINAESLDILKNAPKSELEQLKNMGKQALSNLVGGIGYFSGKIQINLDTVKDGRWARGFRYAIEKKGLLTGTPSRSFFARGFLWDEGFHNIIISQWNPDLSLDIINSWLSTQSATGWMAREQIRGPEAESQVPEKFIEQDKMVANPPTFIFPIENLMNYYKNNFEKDPEGLSNYRNFLKKCLDKLSAWFEWYEIHQKSAGDQKAFQWYGRTTEHNLACGLDDFPRGMNPNIHERHLDLHSWVTQLLITLRNLSEIHDNDSVDHFEKMIKKNKENLFALHHDEKLHILNDYLGPQFKLVDSKKFNRKVPPYTWRGDGRCGKDAPNALGLPAECNPYSDSPCCSEWGWCGNSPGHCKCEKCFHSKKLEDRRGMNKENIFNPHIGYVNLYPIIFGYLDPEGELFGSLLEFLSDPKELFSDYGIRSLSKSDLLYHTGEDYWRGNIWINMNFLTLRGLYKFYKNVPAAYDVYKKLRNGLVNSIFKEWKSSKMFYEQYSDIDGKGLRANPFNGWTSLILSIITERYDD